MRKPEAQLRIYTVVDVMSGVGVGARSFCGLAHARAYLRWLREKRNVNQDDVQLFEDTVDLPIKRSEERRVGKECRL